MDLGILEDMVNRSFVVALEERNIVVTVRVGDSYKPPLRFHRDFFVERIDELSNMRMTLFSRSVGQMLSLETARRVATYPVLFFGKLILTYGSNNGRECLGIDVQYDLIGGHLIKLAAIVASQPGLSETEIMRKVARLAKEAKL